MSLLFWTYCQLFSGCSVYRTITRCHAPGIFHLPYSSTHFFKMSRLPQDTQTKDMTNTFVDLQEHEEIQRLLPDYSLLPLKSQTSLLSTPIGPSSINVHSTSCCTWRIRSCMVNIHWGQGPLEMGGHILCTFEMQPYHVPNMLPLGTFHVHLGCGSTMCLTYSNWEHFMHIWNVFLTCS